MVLFLFLKNVPVRKNVELYTGCVFYVMSALLCNRKFDLSTLGRLKFIKQFGGVNFWHMTCFDTLNKT